MRTQSTAHVYIRCQWSSCLYWFEVMANSNVTAAIDKVRVIVLGDSGVGKTSLVHLISHNKVIRSPSWTIGCSVEVKLHEYREGTPVQKPYFIELWDLGGSSAHRNARSVFYTPTHGMILVHDLTNRKSEENLQKWLTEVLNPDSCSFGKSNSHYDEFDSENFLGSTQVKIPILVIGSKLDLLDSKMKAAQKSRNKIAEQCGCDEIFVDCLDVRSFAAGSSNAVILSRFFDKVIERKYYTRDITAPFDKRRGIPTPLFNTYSSPRLYHMD